MKAKGWSVPQLLKASRMKIDRSSLQRKLSGDQVLSTEEAQKLAEALGCTLVWVPDEDDEVRAS
jgi:ribosome-binding protein aMBF1 (putative translation factor)